MSNFMYNISRYWNRLAFKVVDLGRVMIWDYTEKNDDYIGKENFVSQTGRDILTETQWR